VSPMDSTHSTTGESSQEGHKPVDEATGYLSFYRLAMEDETITARELITNLVQFERDPERLKGGCCSQFDCTLQNLRKINTLSAAIGVHIDPA